MASTPPNWTTGDPNAPFDPTNVNDPRYDPSRDPRYDPRWQKAQQRFYRDQQRSQANQERATQRAQASAWKAQARTQQQQWKMYWRGQQRTSIIGPLLLIAIGVVFFLIHSGRISPFGFFGWYSHWWPLLLIAVGVLRLAEWAIDRARRPEGAPTMRYSVGGGVIFTLIVLASIGLLLRGGARWHADHSGIGFFAPSFGGGDMDHFFGQKHEEDAPAMVRSIAADGSLSIDNPHGEVTVSGTSDDGKVHVSVHKEVYTNSDDTATNRLRELMPSLEGAEDNLTLRVPVVESGGADLNLLVPPTTRIVLNSNHGDVHVTNLKAPLAVTSNNGDVEIAAITGNVQVHVNNRNRDLNVRSVTGDVTVDGNGDEVTMSDITGVTTIRGDFYGGGHLQHVSQAVEYHSSRTDLSFAHLPGELQIDGHDLTASEVVGPMQVNTRSRNISLDKVTGDIKVTNNHGDVDVHAAPPTGTITVDNQHGNVNVTMPDRARFTLNAETSEGDTHSDFDGSHTDGGRGVLSGAVNGGGPAVKINTSHGDINVGKNSIMPLPPTPPAPRLSGVVIPAPPDVSASAASATADAQKLAQDAIREADAELQEARRKRQEAGKLAREAAREKQ